MENFFKQLLAQIVTYLVFVVLMLFSFACLMTGEFPPKKESVKAQYLALLELKKNSIPLIKMAAEKLKSGGNLASTETTADAGAIKGIAGFNFEDLKGQLVKQNELASQFGEVRQEQARLKNQMDILIQQNNEIIKLLNRR